MGDARLVPHLAIKNITMGSAVALAGKGTLIAQSNAALEHLLMLRIIS